jgi:hypothetical protein
MTQQREVPVEWETALTTFVIFLVTLVIGLPMVDEWRERKRVRKRK